MSLVLQAGGGAISVIANDYSLEYVGIHLMLAGLALQVFSLVVVLGLSADFAWCCWRKPMAWEEQYEDIRRRRYFKGFICGKFFAIFSLLYHGNLFADSKIRIALVLATVAILLRSSFRVAELSGGFHGKLWNDEAAFMGMDGAMVALSGTCLTAFHPGLAFHGKWAFVKRG
jgi:hypothetical protein